MSTGLRSVTAFLFAALSAATLVAAFEGARFDPTKPVPWKAAGASSVAMDAPLAVS